LGNKVNQAGKREVLFMLDEEKILVHLNKINSINNWRSKDGKQNASNLQEIFQFSSIG